MKGCVVLYIVMEEESLKHVAACGNIVDARNVAKNVSKHGPALVIAGVHNESPFRNGNVVLTRAE